MPVINSRKDRFSPAGSVKTTLGMPHFSVSGYRRRSSRYSFGDMPYSRRNAR